MTRDIVLERALRISLVLPLPLPLFQGLLVQTGRM